MSVGVNYSSWWCSVPLRASCPRHIACNIGGYHPSRLWWTRGIGLSPSSVQIVTPRRRMLKPSCGETRNSPLSERPRKKLSFREPEIMGYSKSRGLLKKKDHRDGGLIPSSRNFQAEIFHNANLTDSLDDLDLEVSWPPEDDSIIHSLRPCGARVGYYCR